ncbi:unnamed protein product, partial [Amoebophrya sp. A25]
LSDFLFQELPYILSICGVLLLVHLDALLNFLVANIFHSTRNKKYRFVLYPKQGSNNMGSSVRAPVLKKAKVSRSCTAENIWIVFFCLPFVVSAVFEGEAPAGGSLLLGSRQRNVVSTATPSTATAPSSSTTGRSGSKHGRSAEEAKFFMQGDTALRSPSSSDGDSPPPNHQQHEELQRRHNGSTGDKNECRGEVRLGKHGSSSGNKAVSDEEGTLELTKQTTPISMIYTTNSPTRLASATPDLNALFQHEFGAPFSRQPTQGRSAAGAVNLRRRDLELSPDTPEVANEPSPGVQPDLGAGEGNNDETNIGEGNASENARQLDAHPSAFPHEKNERQEIDMTALTSALERSCTTEGADDADSASTRAIVAVPPTEGCSGCAFAETWGLLYKYLGKKWNEYRSARNGPESEVRNLQDDGDHTNAGESCEDDASSAGNDEHERSLSEEEEVVNVDDEYGITKQSDASATTTSTTAHQEELSAVAAASALSKCPIHRASRFLKGKMQPKMWTFMLIFAAAYEEWNRCRHMCPASPSAVNGGAHGDADAANDVYSFLRHFQAEHAQGGDHQQEENFCSTSTSSGSFSGSSATILVRSAEKRNKRMLLLASNFPDDRPAKSSFLLSRGHTMTRSESNILLDPAFGNASSSRYRSGSNGCNTQDFLAFLQLHADEIEEHSKCLQSSMPYPSSVETACPDCRVGLQVSTNAIKETDRVSKDSRLHCGKRSSIDNASEEAT